VKDKVQIHTLVFLMKVESFTITINGKFMIPDNNNIADTPWAQAKARIFNPPIPAGTPLTEADKSALSQILDTLMPTKDSIKKGKDFIMNHPDSASSIANFMSTRVQHSPDFTARLNIIYLLNDVLHHSVKSQQNEVKGPFIDAALPYIPAILYTTYQNQSTDNQIKVSKLLSIWKTKQIYEEPQILQLEADMKGESLKQPVSHTPDSPINRPTPQQLQITGAYHAVPPPAALNPPPQFQAGPSPQQQQGNRLMNNLDSFLSSSRSKSDGSSRHSDKPNRDRSRDRRDDRGDREYERTDRDREYEGGRPEPEGRRERRDSDRGHRDRGDIRSRYERRVS